MEKTYSKNLYQAADLDNFKELDQEKKQASQAFKKEWRAVRNKYSVKEIIGEGAFGQVVYAKDRATRQKVAIKK